MNPIEIEIIWKRNFDFHGFSRCGEGRFTVLCRKDHGLFGNPPKDLCVSYDTIYFTVMILAAVINFYLLPAAMKINSRVR